MIKYFKTSIGTFGEYTMDTYYFQILQDSIATKVIPTDYFLKTIRTCHYAAVLYSVNGGTCGFKTFLSQEEIMKNLNENNNIFSAFMNSGSFPNNTNTKTFSQEYQSCINFAKTDGTHLEISFMLLDKKGIYYDRFVLSTNDILSSAYVNSHLRITQNQIEINATRKQPITHNQQGFLLINLFLTQEDYYLSKYTTILNHSITIKNELSVKIPNLDKFTIEKVKNSYQLILQIDNFKEQTTDQFSTIIALNQLQEVIIYNISVLTGIVAIFCGLGSLQIFVSRKVRIRGQIRSINVDELLE